MTSAPVRTPFLSRARYHGKVMSKETAGKKTQSKVREAGSLSLRWSCLPAVPDRKKHCVTMSQADFTDGA